MKQRFSSMTLVTAPAIEPLTLAEVRDHCRIDNDDSDAILRNLIRASRAYSETYLHRALIQQTWDITFPAFGDMEIPKAPLSSVTSVKYYDEDAVQQTLASSVYKVASADPSYITLDEDQEWPTVQPIIEPITVRIVAGYGDEAEDVPQMTRQAMLILISHWYENREASIVGVSSQTAPLGVQSLLSPDRLHTL